MGWEHFGLYAEAIERWMDRTSFPAHQRAGKILDTSAVEMQAKLRFIDKTVINSADACCCARRAPEGTPLVEPDCKSTYDHGPARDAAL